ncbi:MAG: tRNA epoxyqueuosine(34) reductase QueG [Rikenellaceae bacterium]
MVSRAEIAIAAEEAGFDLFGVTRAEPMVVEERCFREWLAMEYGDTLSYLHRNLDLRFDPSTLVAGGRSVIVCAANYKSHHSLSRPNESGAGIASYATMRDYHKTLRKRLKQLLTTLQRLHPELSGRVFTDSAPLLEKSLAVRAGIGWIGRNSLVITPQYGSFILLGEVVIDADVESYDTPIEGRGCGECRRCVDVCPARAINDNRTIDARRCIACRTIEVEDWSDEPLAGWIFGCDSCQSLCPHNQRTPLATAEWMKPTTTPPTAEEWITMSEERFATLTQGTPLRRTTLRRMQHSININLKDQNQ